MRRISQLIFLLIGLTISAIASATAQVPDAIIINGKEYPLNTNPLTPYLRDKKWTRPKEATTSTANWRGYTATWEVVDNRLTLKDVTIKVRSEENSHVPKSILRDLFPENETVVATWYSGALVIPDGEMTRYVHMGYASMYSHYKVLRVTNGLVKEQLSLTEREFDKYKEAKFREFMKTSDYERARTELLKGETSMPPDQLRRFMMSFYAETYLAL